MKAKIKTQMTEGMKQRDKGRVEVLRRLLSSIQYEEVAQNIDTLKDDAVLAVLKKEIKKSKEELEFAEKAKRPDLIEKVKSELAIIEKFIPAQLSREELGTIIKKIVTSQPGANIGSIMKSLKESHTGLYDGKLANEVAQEVLKA